MSSRSLSGGPETGGDAPSFTCEVCKISVRSAQKLLDHVNFSPLHKAALEGDLHGGVGPHSPTKGRSGQRRILYDGTKLFWRINETLELCIYEDTGANCITITAAPQDPQQDTHHTKAEPQLLLDRRSVLHAAAEDAKQPTAIAHNATRTMGGHQHPPHALSAEIVSKYLLARLQGKRNGSGLSLFLQKLKDDELEPIVLSQPHQLTMPPTDMAMRRRHTYDEVKTAQKEVNEAAVELKKARVQAETLSNLARVTLEAFSKRGSNGQLGFSRHGHGHAGGSGGSGAGAGSKSEWLRVYDRVQFKSAVEHNKDIMGHHH